MNAPIYNIKGKEAGTIDLPEALFGVRKNASLVHQVITALRANARAAVAHTKGRGEIRGGGRKPWAQKGTGRARHGSSRSPLWRGGGTTHGPLSNKNYEQKINKKMNKKALAVVMSEKYRDGKVLFVDEMPITAVKTASARAALTGLGSIKSYGEVATRRTNAVLLVMPAKNDSVIKSFRNMGQVSVVEARNLTALDLLTYRYTLLVSPKESVATLATRVSNK